MQPEYRADVGIKQNKDAVLVVGMHRSGTSVLTRGLKAIGVQLGDHLASSAEDNLRGFWEDKDVLAVNEKILRAVGRRWDSVSPVSLASLQDKLFRPLRDEGKALLEERFGKESLWGIKDLRLSRSLPYWLPLIEEMGARPHLLLAVRHPASIAHSLAVRNGLSEEHSALLCLGHWLDVLRSVDSINSLVIDYDDFLEDGERYLVDIADWLGVEVSSEISTEIDDFSSNFLCKSLRHTRATEQDTMRWKESGGCFALAIDLYTELRQSSPESPGKIRSWETYFRDYELLTPTLNHMDALHDASHARTAELESQMQSRDQEIFRLNDVVDKSSIQLRDLSDQLSIRVNQLAELEGRHTELEGRHTELEGRHTELEHGLEASQAREGQLAQQLEASQWRESELTQNLEQTQHHYTSILAYQSGIKKMLERERYTVLKPMARHLYRMGVSTVLSMPPWVQPILRRIKRGLLPKSIALQVPAWDMSVNQGASDDVKIHPDIPSCEENSYDVIVFPVIDWHFRVQRPQHIAKYLAQNGHRVFYFSTTFGNGRSGVEVLEQIEERVLVCQFNMPPPHPVIYEKMPSKAQEKMLIEALGSFMDKAGMRKKVAIVDHPFWRSVAMTLPGTMVVYDCMDDHGGFSNNADVILQSEVQLFQEADLVITTSATLSEKVSKRRNNILIRNAADAEWFAQQPDTLAFSSERPVVGYFGAISEWFDMDLVIKSAEAYPEYDFVLVGSTFLCDTRKADETDNIHFVGEVSYADLKGYLYAFDVCLIPFKLIELIQCTNPVKLYEYLAAGKPVVTTDMPELRLIKEHVYLSQDSESFIVNIQQAMESKDEREGIASRQAFALGNQWGNRVEQLEESIKDNQPSVSVVVLTYNNIEYTRACLKSLERFTNYSNWELIIVDNASTDGSPEFLSEYVGHRETAKLILNKDNLGFSAGNNAGIKQASGDYVVLLNNDTYVTDGWLFDLIRHFRRDESLGVVGPVTNNIGNEGRIEINYDSMEGMAIASRKYVQEHSRELVYVDTAAFYCVAIKRDVIDKVGLLDEAFGRGFFEDDDYCMRARNAGYKVAIADDTFVHHHLSASFSALKAEERHLLFENNKAVYEAKWGPWKPHQYRKPDHVSRQRIISNIFKG
jgi:GT2 family glycosyltransferase/glycosyltransferase involved in cell wall biosynthesis